MRNVTSTAIMTAVIVMIGPLADRSHAIEDTGQWFALFSQGKVSDYLGGSNRLKWWFDGHLRLFDDLDGFGQSIVRPGLGWQLDDHSTLWAGYGWIHVSPAIRAEFDEHRVWQQWTWSKEFDPFKVALRSRLEQRFLETGDDTGLRFRQFIRSQRSLGPCSPLLLVVWDELFFHLNDTDWGANRGFDQNRVFVGIGLKQFPSSRWRTELGYLNQAINTNGRPNIVNHIFALNLFRSP